MVDRYDEELFLGYVEGTLSHEQAVAFEKQMLEDARLRNLVAHMVLDRHRLRGLPDDDAPADLMQRVNERLERQMLLGGVPAEPTAAAGNGAATRFVRYLVYASLAAMVLISVGLVIYTLMPTPLLDQPDLRRNTSLAMREAAKADGKQRSARRAAPQQAAEMQAPAIAKESDAGADVAGGEQRLAGSASGDNALAMTTPTPAPEPPAAQKLQERAEISAEQAQVKDETAAAGLALGQTTDTAKPPAHEVAAAPAPAEETPVAAKPAEALAMKTAPSAAPGPAVADTPAVQAQPRAPTPPAPPALEGDARAALRRDALGESTTLLLTISSVEPDVTRHRIRNWASEHGLTLSEAVAPPAAAPSDSAPLRLTMPAERLVELLKVAQDSGQSMRVQMGDAQPPQGADAATWRGSTFGLRQDVPLTPMLPMFDRQTTLRVSVVVQPWSAEPSSGESSETSAGEAGR